MPPWLYRVLARMIQMRLDRYCYPEFVAHTHDGVATGPENASPLSCATLQSWFHPAGTTDSAGAFFRIRTSNYGRVSPLIASTRGKRTSKAAGYLASNSTLAPSRPRRCLTASTIMIEPVSGSRNARRNYERPRSTGISRKAGLASPNEWRPGGYRLIQRRDTVPLRSRPAKLGCGTGVRLPGAADHHLLRLPDVRALLPGRVAIRR